MKKSSIYIYVLALLVLSLSACTKENQPLRLGTMPTYSAAIYAVGIEKGFFEDAGVVVDLTVFRSARDRDAGATAGELDGFMTDIMGAVNLNAKGFPFMMTSREYEVFGLMAASDLKSEDSSKVSIGISENTVVEFIVDTYVKESVEKVNILALPDRMGALLGKELDYGVFPQPFIGIIIGNGGQMTFNTESENFYPVVLVFDEDYIKDHKDSVSAFYKGYQKTITYMQENNYDDYKEALVNVGIATDENVDLFRLPVTEFGLNGVDQSTYDLIINWMKDKELLTKEIKFEDIYTSQFIE